MGGDEEEMGRGQAVERIKTLSKRKNVRRRGEGRTGRGERERRPSGRKGILTLSGRISRIRDARALARRRLSRMRDTRICIIRTIVTHA